MTRWIKQKLLVAVTAAVPVALFVGAPMLAAGCKGLGTMTDAIGQSIGGSTGSAISAAGRGMKAASLDERDEHEMGRSVAIVVTNKYRLLVDSRLNDYVTLVGLTVAMSSPRPDYDYCFGILDTDEVGAFSGPTGYILITRGALARMQDESELAGVLAHEIGHVALHHGLEAVKNAGMTQAFNDAVNTSKELSQFGQLVDGASDVIVNKGYSRTQESAADAEAAKYLVAAGYLPGGYVRFLRRIEAEQHGGGGGGGGAMSTHPGSRERVTALNRQLADMGSPGGQSLKDRFQRSTATLRRAG